jgi:hypothetical protein
MLTLMFRILLPIYAAVLFGGTLAHQPRSPVPFLLSRSCALLFSGCFVPVRALVLYTELERVDCTGKEWYYYIHATVVLLLLLYY